MKKTLAALVVVPLLAVTAACSGDGGGGNKQSSSASQGGANSSSGQSGSPSAGSSSGTSASSAPRTGMSGSVQKSDAGQVEITSCKATNAGVSVTGKITNITDKANSYVIAIVAEVAGKRVDGLALLANNVAAGKTAEASRQGKVPVKGTPTCKIADIAAIPVG